MKKNIFALVAITLALSLPAQKVKWTPLFNGKNLSGWNQKGGNARYTIEKGTIVGTTVANTPNSFLCTNQEYGDFILELELKVDDAMNSGIQFRSLSLPDYQNGRVHGYQMEVDPSARAWSGGIYDEGRRDWLYIPNLNPESKKAFRHNQWNHYRIEAIGNTLRTWVNGIPVSHLVDNLTAKGFIALQVHSIYGNMSEGMKIQWRNIRIQDKNLQPSPTDNTPVVNLIPNNLSEQEKAQGFQALFNGTDLAGWHGIHSEIAPSKRWSVIDGAIVSAPTDNTEPNADLITQEQYATFELVFEFKLTKGADSGVKYFVDEKNNPGEKSGIGPEYQILDDENHPDAQLGVVGNRTLASLYDLIPAEKPAPRFRRKIGDWNQGRILVYPNNSVIYYLNGFKVLEYERKSNIFKALVARSKYEKVNGFGLNDQGYILLQDHGDQVSFRSLKIRPLLSEIPPCD